MLDIQVEIVVGIQMRIGNKLPNKLPNILIDKTRHRIYRAWNKKGIIIYDDHIMIDKYWVVKNLEYYDK